MPLHDLTAFNTLGLTSAAPALLRYRHPEQLTELSDQAARYENVFVLGGGSNIVLPPVLTSLVIKVESTGRHVLEETADSRIIEVDAGEAWHEFVTWCVDQGWGGLENLALIPGTVGAAPVQNIGAYGVELDQRLHSVVAWDLQRSRLMELSPEDCRFSYRNSMFKQAEAGRWLIVRVRFNLPLSDSWKPVLHYPDLQRHAALMAMGAAVTPKAIFDAVCDIRRQKLPDPAVLANAGSFFKNPVVDDAQYQAIRQQWPDVVAYLQPDSRWKLAAGWLIEQSGWKGRRLGPVAMHQRQALVLVNCGGADAKDVADLAHQVCIDVKQRFCVDLEQEPIAVV